MRRLRGTRAMMTNLGVGSLVTTLVSSTNKPHGGARESWNAGTYLYDLYC